MSDLNLFLYLIENDLEMFSEVEEKGLDAVIEELRNGQIQGD